MIKDEDTYHELQPRNHSIIQMYLITVTIGLIEQVDSSLSKNQALIS